MTRQELLAAAKPILFNTEMVRAILVLFNTEMVRAILGGKKTVTRRVVKPQPNEQHKFKLDFVASSTHKKDIGYYGWGLDEYGGAISYAKPPYKVGDILYVRETWQEKPIEIGGGYFYKEETKDPNNYTWKPSIHMPKEAARIFLRVTDVRVKRLQDMNGNDLEKEGIKTGITHFKSQINNFGNAERYEEALATFAKLWNSTIKKADIDTYGWNANQWVWVIEFERVETE